MSAESVSRAITSVVHRGPITAQSFEPVANAAGRYQDGNELKRMQALQASMNSGVVDFSADGMEAVNRQIAKGDEVAKAVAERIDASPKHKRLNRLTAVGFIVGTPSLIAGFVIGGAGIALPVAVFSVIMGLAIAGISAAVVGNEKSANVAGKIGEELRSTLPD